MRLQDPASNDLGHSTHRNGGHFLAAIGQWHTSGKAIKRRLYG